MRSRFSGRFPGRFSGRFPDRFSGRCSDRGISSDPGTTASTASQTPNSTAAAARHTMPAAVAPPRSTRSPKSSGRPRYSESVAGANMSDSAIPWHDKPFTAAGSTPASSHSAHTQPSAVGSMVTPQRGQIGGCSSPTAQYCAPA